MTGTGYELERLRAELSQEKQMKEMLEQSTGELELTVRELDKRADTIEGEDNEWKTRYTMQVEMNMKLETDVQTLMEKLQDAKETYNKSKQPKSVRTTDLNELSPHHVKRLEKERDRMEGQLHNLENRLDQESKAYHKAHEQRKKLQLEIGAAKGSLEFIRRHGKPSHDVDTSRGGMIPNIPPDQRILDPRHGPVKKTAAVKSLPRLE